MNCRYCQRTLIDPKTDKFKRSNLSATWDHVQPKSRGGRKTVRACLQCNRLKGDLDPNDWKRFTASNARYWKSFRTHGEVARWLSGNKSRRALKREARTPARFPRGLVALPPLCRGLPASGPHGGAD